MSRGHRSRDLKDINRTDVLAALSQARTSLIEAKRHMRPRSGLSRSAEAVIAEIDDFAFVLTGSREHFHLKAHGTPARRLPEDD
ncbi:MAG: hypothetical protein K5905_13405 [Roseibium sp.]|uniref:hypothetical protein n=1 Tax=Roseibium sp. TaxID=1936156 RepID=UPI00262CCE61|nr:hypothetical protein [Roseibium sp.]MCV0426464.1 hypothetical protein [Roseibium sp.]